MTNYACFLRGINVGGHRKIPMADLRALVAEVTGCRDVQSYIASGKVVFSTDQDQATLKSDLRAAIQDQFGFDVPLMLLSQVALTSVMAGCPCPDAQGNLVHGFLCNAEPRLDLAGIKALKTRTETVTCVGQTVWLHAPDGVGRSKLAAKFEKLVGVEATARNLNTLRKVETMLAALS